MDRTEYTMLRRLIRQARREDLREPRLLSTKIMQLRQPSREQRLLELVPPRLRDSMRPRGNEVPVSPLAAARLAQYRARRGRGLTLGRAIAEYHRHFPIAA